MTHRAHGTLLPNEPHPSAQDALAYVLAVERTALSQYQEAFSSCALEGNRLAEVCAETLHRVMHGEPVSDRYILGLAWILKARQENTTITLSVEGR